MDKENVPYQLEPIAVIGMSCRFPGAADIDAFWRNLREGRESLTFFSAEELAANGVDPDLTTHPNYVNAACVIDDIAWFDPAFFGYTMAEAELVDPQQRLLLECAYEAFEDAGYPPRSDTVTTGVFGGVRTSGYAKILSPLLKRTGTARGFEAVLGTSVDQACLRVSHGLNLTGPSIGVQTACSTSLVAIHMACESLRNGECDMALAGASAVHVPQKQGYLYEEGMIASPDGHCRAFDINAKGTMAGNGVGMVLLKRLSEAWADRDHIYAVVRGSAVNNDGASKVGYRAPSVEGQAAVIDEAMQMAGVDADSLSYIEANGTGTFLGDSMEIEAMTRVFGPRTDRKGFCGIGSVETNIGHLTQAAGIAGFIKTVLSLKNRELPPSLNCDVPNPKLHHSPFFVNTRLSRWDSDGSPRRAGVSAFAVGGTNSHVVVEEAPPVHRAETEASGHVLTLSAKTGHGLKEMARRYTRFLNSVPDEVIGDVCFTANTGRPPYAHRLAAVGDSRQQLYERIRAFVDGETAPLSCFTGIASPIGDTGIGETELRSLEKEFRDRRNLLEKLAASHVRGTSVDWAGFYRDRSCRRIRLPAYPFERKHCWFGG